MFLSGLFSNPVLAHARTRPRSAHYEVFIEKAGRNGFIRFQHYCLHPKAANQPPSNASSDKQSLRTPESYLKAALLFHCISLHMRSKCSNTPHPPAQILVVATDGGCSGDLPRRTHARRQAIKKIGTPSTSRFSAHGQPPTNHELSQTTWDGHGMLLLQPVPILRILSKAKLFYREHPKPVRNES